jgi:hypothetical protein
MKRLRSIIGWTLFVLMVLGCWILIVEGVFNGSYLRTVIYGIGGVKYQLGEVV